MFVADMSELIRQFATILFALMLQIFSCGDANFDLSWCIRALTFFLDLWPPVSICCSRWEFVVYSFFIATYCVFKMLQRFLYFFFVHRGMKCCNDHEKKLDTITRTSCYPAGVCCNDSMDKN
jgi:hypothetical protein